MDLEVAIPSAKNGDSAGLVKAMTEGGGSEALLSVPGFQFRKLAVTLLLILAVEQQRLRLFP